MVYYDLLRSTAAGDFLTHTCLATGVTSTSSRDSASPGTIFYYLVRSENVCGGNLGAKSDGTQRIGGSCP